jgi:hypothetical protein
MPPNKTWCWHFHDGNGYTILFSLIFALAAWSTGWNLVPTVIAIGFSWACLMLSLGSGFSRGHCDFGLCRDGLDREVPW